MTILGIDLGVGSVGWALIEIEENTFAPIKIIGMGSRIISLAPDETKAFTSSGGETPCAKRTFNRSARRMLLRWKQRRKHLQNLLHRLGMYDREDTLNSLPPLDLWKLRANAANPDCTLSLKELGRVILHLSTKRGYKHSRLDSGSDKEDTEYVANINKHYSELKESGLTVGQYLYDKLRKSETAVSEGKGGIVTYRIKEGDPDYTNLFPREAHIEELTAILNAQKIHYPDILTDDIINEIENIIFYQRPLKSCKNLVSRCEMFDFKFVNSNGKTVDCNPRVAPKTSPVAQLTRIWETVNNIRLINSKNKILNPSPAQAGITTLEYRKTLEKFDLNQEERERVAEYLFTHEKLTATDLLKLLGLKRADGFKSETNIGKGIKGNKTYTDLFNALSNLPNRDELLKFTPSVNEIVDSQTGEIRYVINADIINQPLYRLWHLIYSIPDRDDLKKTLTQQFGITDSETLDALVKLDFRTPGFSNRSVKFMRRILPYLMTGDMYSTACAKAGFRHSDYLTKDENELRPISDSIANLGKGSLRQPLVEKILNQMINIVNDIIDKYGPVDEIRVELARELKQSKEQRIKAVKDISANEKQNEQYAKLIEQHGIKVNRRTLQKYRMWEETEHRCIYCNQPINVVSFLSGELSDVEHIIPRSLFFDDSFSNKTCSCTLCNHSKGQMTAYDFMKQKGEQALIEFQKRVEELAERKKISATKLKRFLTPAADIPQDFIERDLQQTRFISRKAIEILKTVCRNVYASSGKVTDFFRNAWGYNRLLENLNLDRYENAGMVEHSGSRSTIKEWTKRLDHRHHAVDALTIALTRQGYIQRLSTLNSSRDDLRKEVGDKYSHQFSLLEQWAALRPHFSAAEVMNKLSTVGVSFKPGKKAATTGFNGKSKNKVSIPRGPLHEDTVYGKIYLPDKNRPLNDCLKNPEIIADPTYRKAVIDLLNSCNGDITAAKKYLQKNPLLTPGGRQVTEFATLKPKFIKREALRSLKANQIDNIVDEAIKKVVRQRFDECGKSEIAFQQSLSEHPLYLKPDMPYPIKRVKCKTGLNESSMIAIRKDGETPVGYAKTGNNHHSAFYMTADDKVIEMTTTLWTAVKRKNIGLPIIIENPDEARQVLNHNSNHPDFEHILSTLPPAGSNLLFTLAQNEMVVIGLDDKEWDKAVKTKDLSTIAFHLYRVQSISAGDYMFRHHTHAEKTKTKADYNSGNFIRIASWKAFCENHVRKISVDKLGNIILPAND